MSIAQEHGIMTATIIKFKPIIISLVIAPLNGTIYVPSS